MRLKNLLVLLTMGIFAVACSDENDVPPNPYEMGQTVAGTYSGLMSMSVNEEEVSSSLVNLTLSAVYSGSVTLSLPQMGEGTTVLQAFQMTGLAISMTTDGGTYYLDLSSGTSFTPTNDSSVSYAITDFEGIVSGDSFTLTFTVTPSDTGTAIDCVFNTVYTDAQAITGSYDGLQTMMIGSAVSGMSTVTYTLSVDDDGLLTISVPAGDGSSSMSLQAFDITGVILSQVSSGSYTLVLGTDSYSTTIEREGSTPITYTITNFSGTYADGNLSVTYDLQPGSMPMSITFEFTTDYTLANLIAGTYSGELSMSVSSTSMGTSEVEYTLTAADDGTLTISVPAAGSGSMSMLAFDLEGVAVTAGSADGEYVLSLDDVALTLDKGDGTLITYTITNFSGTYADGDLYVTYGLQPGSMPMSITFEFTTVTETGE